MRLLPRVLLPAFSLLGSAALGLFARTALGFFTGFALRLFAFDSRLFGGAAALLLGGTRGGLRRLFRFGLRVVASGRAYRIPNRNVCAAFIAKTQRESPLYNISYSV